MVKIALDATYAADPSPTGIGVYCRNLISALAASPPFQNASEYQMVLCFRPGRFLRSRKMTWPPGATRSPLLDFWPRPGHVRLFHGMNQRLPATPYPARVVTIHDLFPLTSREYSHAGFQRHFSEILRTTIARADRIIAVSDATRRELLQHTDAADAKIRVVHHGIAPPRLPSQAERDAFVKNDLGLNPQERFFLNVGSIQVRKNVSNIARALQRVPGYRLVLAGGDGHGAAEIHALIEREGLAGRVIRLGHTPPERLPLLYSTARVLVFPSFEEGFGFPILEAMSYGCPVITSNCSSMPEVAGDAALLVDPLDVSAISEAMRRTAEDDVLVKDLRNKGRERVRLFSWEKCARQTWEVYRESLKSDPRADTALSANLAQ